MKTIKTKRMIGGELRSVTYYYTDYGKIEIIKGTITSNGVEQDITVSKNEEYQIIKTIKETR